MTIWLVWPLCTLMCLLARAAGPQVKWVPCFITLAMGDCNAVEYAQSVHMSLAMRADALSDSSLICAQRASPTSAYKAGLVIDDHVAFREEACTVFDPP